MMCAARYIEQDVPAGIVKNRRNDGEVRKMCAAVVGVVEHEDIAGA